MKDITYITFTDPERMEGVRIAYMTDLRLKRGPYIGKWMQNMKNLETYQTETEALDILPVHCNC